MLRVFHSFGMHVSFTGCFLLLYLLFRLYLSISGHVKVRQLIKLKVNSRGDSTKIAEEPQIKSETVERSISDMQENVDFKRHGTVFDGKLIPLSALLPEIICNFYCLNGL